MRLILRLRFGRISLRCALSSPKRPFPIKHRPAVSPTALPNCHLDRTAIPHTSVIKQQPRSFPLQSSQSLASFAVKVSSGITVFCPAAAKSPACTTIHPAHSRQATLPAVMPHGRFHPDSYSVVVCSAQEQVSTERGSSSACHCGLPPDLNSQHQPPTGIESKHKELHRYALIRIFRPVLRIERSD